MSRGRRASRRRAVRASWQLGLSPRPWLRLQRRAGRRLEFRVPDPLGGDLFSANAGVLTDALATYGRATALGVVNQCLAAAHASALDSQIARDAASVVCGAMPGAAAAKDIHSAVQACNGSFDLALTKLATLAPHEPAPQAMYEVYQQAQNGGLTQEAAIFILTRKARNSLLDSATTMAARLDDIVTLVGLTTNSPTIESHAQSLMRAFVNAQPNFAAGPTQLHDAAYNLQNDRWLVEQAKIDGSAIGSNGKFVSCAEAVTMLTIEGVITGCSSRRGARLRRADRARGGERLDASHSCPFAGISNPFAR